MENKTDYTVKVATPLKEPIKINETIDITQIDQYDNYICVSSSDDFAGGDICEVTNFLMKKLKELGHDGSLKIELTKYVYEKVEEKPLSSLMNEFKENNDKTETVFIFDKEGNACKYYYTKDREFQVILRNDGKCLLFRLNHKKDFYEWTEVLLNNLKECEFEMNKLLKKGKETY